jgi:uncharacterized membrane protein YbhN (UPF0104 family)
VKIRFIRSLVITIISLGIVSAFAYYLYTNADRYLELLQISPLSVLLIGLIMLLMLFINGLSNILLFRGLETELTYREGVYLSAAATFINQLPISGGIVAKGFYLKQKHRFPYTKFFSATLALLLCFFSVDGLIGLSILLNWLILGKAISSALLIGFTLMAVSALIFWIPLDRIKFPRQFNTWFSQALDGWMVISRKPKLALKLIGLQVVLTAFVALRYKIAFQMLSQEITLAEAMLFSTASILTQLVSFAPGGLGVREAIVGAVASALNFEFSVSVVAVGLDRLITTPVILIFGGISVIILSNKLTISPKN